MKKSLIAGAGVAALSLAMVPVLGAFADVTDTLTVTINSSCTVGSTTSSTGAGKTITATMSNNELKTWDSDGTAGGTIKVTCNNAGGWNVKAVGASTGASNTAMTPAGSGTPIATGTATTGATSNWAFKVSGTNTVAEYQTYKAVPATATKVATSSAAVSEGTINTGYQVWMSATQAADTYTGRVTYTVAPGA